MLEAIKFYISHPFQKQREKNIKSTREIEYSEAVKKFVLYAKDFTHIRVLLDFIYTLQQKVCGIHLWPTYSNQTYYLNFRLLERIGNFFFSPFIVYLCAPPFTYADGMIYCL